MGKKRKSLPFDRNGGTLAINRRMLNSPAFMSLTAQQKVLILLLHEQWRNDKAVAYGVREAAEKIPCKLNTACKAFAALAERGFICCVELSQFSSRHGSRAREWRITWMPFCDHPPSNDWEQWQPDN
jgi:hypothetical protein